MSQPASACAEIREALFDALARREPIPQDAARHLRTCGSCGVVAERLATHVNQRRDLADLPLSPEAEARVWRRVRGPDEHPAWARHPGFVASLWNALGWPQLAGIGVGAAVATIAVAWILVAQPFLPAWRAVEVTRQEGAVSLVRGTRQAESLKQRAKLRVGDDVQTGADGEARISVAGHQCVALRSTALRVRSLAKKQVELQLEQGAAAFKSDPQRSQAPALRVVLPRATVAVIGTIFWLETHPDHDEVSVWQGQVVAELPDGRNIALSQGQRLRIGAGEPAVDRIDATEAHERLATLGLPAPPIDPVITAPKPLLQISPIEKEADREIPETTERRHHDARLSILEARAKSGDCAGTEARARAFPKQAPVATRAEAIVIAADCYYAHKDSPRAIRLYREVSDRFRQTPVAENAGYELGRVAREQGDLPQALTAFKNYLRRYPRGALASEALFRVCMLDYAEKRLDDTLQCLGQYQHRFPSGKRMAESNLIEATVYRTAKNDCPQAIRAYDRCLTKPGTGAEECRAWKAWCENQIAKQ